MAKDQAPVADQHDGGIEATMDGNILVLRIDTSREGQPSKSGKSKVLASTHGFHRLAEGRQVSVNLIGPKG